MNYKLYHTSAFVNNSTDVFIPTIPKYAMKGEDTSILRVCLSDAIKHCLMSSSTCREALDNGQKLFKVYEFDIDSQFIVGPKDLYNSCKVMDALLYLEHWCIKDCVPISVFDIEVKSYSTDYGLCVNPRKTTEYNKYLKKLKRAENCMDYDLCDKLYDSAIENEIFFQILVLEDLKYYRLDSRFQKLSLF